MKKNTTMLMILDGFGINEQEQGNSIKLAKIPNISEALKKNPNTIIIKAAEKVTGIAGISHMKRAIATIPINRVFIEISCSVLRVLFAFLP